MKWSESEKYPYLIHIIDICNDSGQIHDKSQNSDTTNESGQSD